MFKTTTIKQKDLQQKWYLIDAQGIRLGRLATNVAGLIMGKNKVARTNNINNGDVVVVVNSGKVDIYKNKPEKKKYRPHSGYIGRIHEQTFAELIKKNPGKIINSAVKGMLPQNKLGKMLLKNLYVYPEADHPHSAQKPIQIKLKNINK